MRWRGRQSTFRRSSRRSRFRARLSARSITGDSNTGAVKSLPPEAQVRPDIQNWIDSAEYDLETARHMLKTGRYLYVVFMCHLSIEKMLKAHVTRVTEALPVKSHDLIFLYKKAGLELPQAQLEFIGLINNASIPTRYPEDLQRALADYPEAVARSYLQRTEEVIRWLKQLLISEE